MLTIHEAVIRTGPERPSMLVMFAAMMGLPFVLRADELTRRRPKYRDEEDVR